MAEIEDLTDDEAAAFEAQRNDTAGLAGESAAAPGAQPGAASPGATPQGGAAEQVEEDPEGTKLIGGQKMVPLSALLGERGRWKDKYGTLEGQLSKGEERLNKLLERFGPAGAAPGGAAPGAAAQGGEKADDGTFKPTVKEEDDPIEYYKQKSEWQDARLAKLEKDFTGDRQQSQAERQQHALMTQVASVEQEFAKTQPDYMPAINFMVQQRKAQLEAYGLNPEQIAVTIINERNALVNASLQAKDNPAARAYKLAQSFGWKPEMAAAGGKGAASAKDLKQVEKTLQDARSLSNARGGGAAVHLDMDTIANMSDEEFDKLMTTNPAAWEQLNNQGFITH